MRVRLALLFVLTLISTVSVANAVEKNSAQMDLSSEAGRVYRSTGNAHEAPRDEKAEAAELYEKLLGHEADRVTPAEPPASISK